MIVVVVLSLLLLVAGDDEAGSDGDFRETGSPLLLLLLLAVDEDDVKEDGRGDGEDGKLGEVGGRARATFELPGKHSCHVAWAFTCAMSARNVSRSSLVVPSPSPSLLLLLLEGTAEGSIERDTGSSDVEGSSVLGGGAGNDGGEGE